VSIESTVGAAVVPPPEMEEADAGGRRKLAEQWVRMPPAWRRADVGLVVATQWTLCVGGVLFAAMITLEVISRYVFSFSISFVNAAARLLLVWFFMLGAGIALRHGAHVGFELITAALPPRARRVVELVGLLAVAVFCYSARKWVGALAAALGGLDALIFTGGIGEHSGPVREEICRDLGYLGIDLDPDRNSRSESVVTADGSRCTVRVIPTDEESVVARHTAELTA